jgi:hypothetical protein
LFKTINVFLKLFRYDSLDNTREFLGLDFGVVKPGIKKEIEVVVLLR